MCPGCGSESPASTTVQTGAATSATATNAAPTIDGTASAYARVGMPYEFQPAASDADGDTLTFSAVNLPPWATLDPQTGHIVGTPTAADVGAYESIVLNVADATHRIATASFEITVLAAPTGVASLQWEIPSSKIDGSPLDDLAGYHIVFGRKPDDLDQSVFVEGANVTSYQIADLDPGVWYFAVAGVNANGLEGPLTTPAMKSI